MTMGGRKARGHARSQKPGSLSCSVLPRVPKQLPAVSQHLLSVATSLTRVPLLFREMRNLYHRQRGNLMALRGRSE